jgi:hypothetical protein
MRRSTRNAVGLATLLALIALATAALGAGSASAITITNWEAGTCSAACSPSQPANAYAQAAGHPPVGVTNFTVGVEGGDQAKRVQVELPAGLNVNPQAVPQCAESDFRADKCAATSQVGTSDVTTEAACRSARSPSRSTT